MTQPTQELPSWLTLSTTVITLPDGALSTASTTLQLPLTYYGPSIPLGTDGVWVYGGLTSPASTIGPTSTSTPESSSPSSSAPSSSSPSSTITPPTSASASPATSPIPSMSTSSASAAPTVVGGSSHGISPSTLGAILGSILGTLLLLVLIAIIFLLRKTRRRQVGTNGHSSSSFWNRSTTLMSFRKRNSQLPIWTGWEIVSPDDFVSDGRHTPGDGSPRGSGEEEDPFLTRHSVRSGTEGHTRTDTDTLVSLPIIARTGTMSTHRSTPKPGERIISREAQMRLDEELGTVPPYTSVRMVERSPSSEDVNTSLLPPLLNDNGRPVSQSSRATRARSMSEKSVASYGTDGQEPEGAELLTARRVRVGQIQPLAGAVAPPSVLGLDRLADLGRMSWFRRMSFLGAPAGSEALPQSEQEADAYTRTPPRHSRNGSRSRPGSFVPVPEHDPDSFGRRPQRDSGLGFGLTVERPISTASGQSHTSGNTMFYDAQSRPSSSVATRSTGNSGSTSVPPQVHFPQPSPLSQQVQQASPSPESSRDMSAEGPPEYATVPLPSASVQYSEVDVLDIPVPRPASPFSAASGSRIASPGLAQLPNPSVWRYSHASSTVSPGTDSTSGIRIDMLEEGPPTAAGGWLHLAGALRPSDGRRTTFGVPEVVQPQGARRSERGSLHSQPSYLSPHSSRSPSMSEHGSSRHTTSGSSSSRPSHSSHSRGPTASTRSLAHSTSISFEDRQRRRRGVGEVVSPPLSAVFPGRDFPGSPLPRVLSATHGDSDEEIFPLPPTYTPVARDRITGGTVTSSGTRGTAATDESLTDLSVTTTQTDPITGAVMHFPRLPWRGAGASERLWSE